MRYVLITPAHNEERFITKTLDSIVAQTVPPERWVIVDDGSTDHTAEIVEKYAKRYSWIELVRRPHRLDRSFAGKVHAFNAGLERVQSLQFEVIGNLDADLSFDPDYLEFLMQKFSEDPKLGVAGTPFTEEDGYDSARDSFEGENHVAGGCQLFRRQCFEDVGGYVPNPAGGIDWIAVTTARMKGWTTRSFAEKRFHHYRTLGTAGRSTAAASFSYGEKDYYLGGSPVWQLFRVAYRMTKRPVLIDGLALFSGYCWAALRRMKRPVSPELMRFHRREQIKKLRAIFRTLLSFKKVDSFRLTTERGRSEDPPTPADRDYGVAGRGRRRSKTTDNKSMRVTKTNDPLAKSISRVLARFTQWLRVFGETSWDHQSFFAGRVGRRAKSLYYRHRLLGTAAVAPMIFCEAFLPSARRLFHQPTRFPIADAHYAMGFAFLCEATGDFSQLENAVHFLTELKKTRCRGFEEHCWGYPFDWVTRNGVLKEQTPLITTTPYVYEAFLQVYEIFQRMDFADERFGQRPDSSQHSTLISQPSTLERGNEWKLILESIARHASFDIQDFRTSETGSSCSYTPFDEGGVINAAAYRAFLLTSASQVFSKDEYWRIAERNLNFVLEAQNPDGSWFYAVDGVRDFVDHYHTCFVMKALAKIHTLTGHDGCGEALAKGVKYYLENLFAEDGLPRPFSKAPRLTVYKRELYDCAECINLCLLLRDRFPALETTLEKVVEHILEAWVKRDGSFRSRKLHLGWDNVPMHRWGQAQMFRSLAFFLSEMLKAEKLKAETLRAEMVKS